MYNGSGTRPLFEEFPSPSSSKILEPLRVNRILSRSLPDQGVTMGSDAGLSDTAESAGDGLHLLLVKTGLLGIQRPNTLRRFRTFFP